MTLEPARLPGLEAAPAERDETAPALAVLVLTALLMGVVLLGQLFAQQDLYFIHKHAFGMDYGVFYKAALRIREGGSPYEVGRYVTPPLPAYLNVAATYLPLPTAKVLIALSVLGTVVGAMFLVRRIFAPPRWRADLVFLGAALGTVLLSYPFYFLFDRGNVDGLVLFLTALGLLALRRSGWLAGVLFGLAVATKVYPVLLVLPLAAKRRWVPLVAMGATLLVLFVLTPGDWLAFVEKRILERGSQWKIDENGSLACTFLYLGRFTADALGVPRFPLAQQIAGLYRPVYFVLLGLLVLRDALRRDVKPKQLCADVALYFPFMVAVPRLVYHYELVWLLALVPVVGWRWANAGSRVERWILGLVVAGIALGQFQAVAAVKLTGSIYPNVVPGFGLFLVMLGVVALAWLGAPRSETGVVTQVDASAAAPAASGA